ncbi:MAG: phosphoglycerate dehydrogenase [bacterium]|nr:phosphoglycerate dehydrogenase [bacterium]
MKVLVSDPLSKEGLDILDKAQIPYEVKTGLREEELVSCISRYNALIVRSETKVTKNIIGAAQNLKVIGRAGVGVDNIDVMEATKRGIVVMNVPGGNTISAAEHTMALLLSLSRNIPQANKSLKEKEWNRKRFRGVELNGKTLGIIGLGRIGREVAKRAKSFVMKVIAFDPYVSEDQAKVIGVELVELEDIYKESDYITLHIPSSDKTRHLISRDEFSKMKPGVRIINCARGGIIDEEALYEAMKEGKVAGCALDVYEKEPPFDSPLLELENCITVPHLGASTKEAQVNVAVEIARQVVDALKNDEIRNAVNIPQIEDIEIKPYLFLCEKIGYLHAQLLSGHIEGIDVEYTGEIANYKVAPLTVAILKGILSGILTETLVNYVNAPLIAKERGIRVVESKSIKEKDFTNLISVRLSTDKEKRVIEGSIFQKDDERIVSIDGFRVDAIPSGYMLVISNIDKPGVIGKIGTILGQNNINIAGLQMGRKAIGGRQLMVLNVDHVVEQEVLKQIEGVDEVSSVRMVKL